MEDSQQRLGLGRHMMRCFTALASFVLICTTLLFLDLSHVSALTTVPTKMNFQGRLTDSAGNIKPNGTYNMRLKLFTVSSGGSNVWSEDRLVSGGTAVTVTNGLFSIQLGSVTTLPASLFASGALYLEVELPTPATATSSSPTWTEGAMTPRNQMATSAYAYNAETLDGIDSANFAQLDAENNFIENQYFDGGAVVGNSFLVGSGLFAVDSSGGGTVTALSNNSGATTSWSTAANAVTAARTGHTTVTANGYIYVIGGDDSGGTPETTVYYAKLNAGGSVGSWQAAANVLPAGRTEHASVVANGYVYVLGGENAAGTKQSTAYYAKLNADGTVGTWQTGTSPAVAQQGAVTANGYAYLVGGNDGASAVTTTYYAKLNADGTMGTWNTTAALGTATQGAAIAAANGYIYASGGDDGFFNPIDNFRYAQLNANGTIGSWTTGTVLPEVREYATSFINNGYIYVTGGTNTGAYTATVYYAQLGATGSTGSWTTASSSLPNGRSNHTSVVANGYAYSIAGLNSGGVASTTVYYSRVGGLLQLGGSLDLVGLQGENLVNGGGDGSGASGGSITAGNITAVGSLQVQSQALFAGSVSVMDDFNTGNGLFAVNTATSKVQIGSAVADAVGTTLILDTKNTAGDPTGVVGAMYYNSNAGKFRCYQGAAWADCIGGGGSNADTLDTLDSLDFGRIASTNTFTGVNAFNGSTFSIGGSANTAKFNVASLLNVDSSGSIVSIGASDTTGTILALDVKTGSGDPTGQIGAMYYNSNAGKFRCYQVAAWADCITTDAATLDTLDSTDFGRIASANTFTNTNAFNGATVSIGGSADAAKFNVASLFNVDSSASKISIGASDTTGTIFILDTKTNAGDPTGQVGAMYYNSNLGRFRCYEGSAWTNCINGYSINVQALTSSPTDAQTVYFGTLPKAPTTTANISKIYIRKAGVIRAAEIYSYSGTAGTGENWSLYVRLNNTTDTLIATVGAATSERVFTNSSLSISVAVGDYIEIKSIQPTWVTNPLTTIYGGYVYIE